MNMTRYKKIQLELVQSPKIWLITGVAGFIGSSLLEALLKLEQHVVGMDNFATGYQTNLNEVQSCVTSKQWEKFQFISGDIRELKDCKIACHGVDYVLHQAALGSVPRSLGDPIATNETNISGFLNMLIAARDAKVSSFTYAASSSTYGDHPALPKVEENIGNPLSPYAVTKYVNELYANVFARCYGLRTIGLRYFNVFGRRQDPNGAYAAVIPKWTAAMILNKNVIINGDGKTSRDFCYIKNVVQANILAATVENKDKDQVYNVAVGDRTDLVGLFNCLKNALDENGISYMLDPEYKSFREGDVRHSQANINKARKFLGYEPEWNLKDGIADAMPWYAKTLDPKQSK